MKLKVQDAYIAVQTLSAIIREKRPLPTKGAYRIARLHAKLLPEFTLAHEKRNELIKAYDYKETIDNLDGNGPQEFDSVPKDKLPEFTKAWGEITSIEIEVDVEPIPLDQLDMGEGVASSIHAGELLDLGALVTD